MKTLKNTTSRRAVVALAGTALVIGAGVLTPTADAAPTPSAAMFCSLTPAADTMPPGPELVGTIRANATEIEVLHRVDCDGRTVEWKWLAPSDILAP